MPQQPGPWHPIAAPPVAWPPRHEGGSPSDSFSDSASESEEYSAGLQRSVQQHGSMQDRAAARTLGSESAHPSGRSAARPPDSELAAGGVPSEATPPLASPAAAACQRYPGRPRGLASSLQPQPSPQQPPSVTMRDRAVTQSTAPVAPVQGGVVTHEATSPASAFSPTSAYATASSPPRRAAPQPAVQRVLNASQSYSSGSSAGPPRRITQVPEDIFVVDSAERAAWAAQVCFNVRGKATEPLS